MLYLGRALLVVSLLIVGFSYGVVAFKHQLFPYGLLAEAGLAFKAWKTVLLDPEGAFAQSLPVGAKRLEPDTAPTPYVQSFASDQTATDGLILMTGGPFQMMDRCPTHGCLAWLMDRSGTIVHTWEVDPKDLWPDISMFTGLVDPAAFYPTGAQLGDSGDLALTFQAFNAFPYSVGIAKLDRDSRILWSHADYSHHWFAMDSAGRLYVPALELTGGLLQIGQTDTRLKCETLRLYEDLVRVLDADGKTLREASVIDLLARSDYAGIVSGTPDPCDPTHLNSIDLAPKSLEGVVEGLQEGDLLISLRSPNVIALLDKDTWSVKYAVTGRTVAQHSPHFLADGRVLVLDNLGGDGAKGGTRIVQLDLVTGALDMVFPVADDETWLPLRTATAGHVDVSGDGQRALVSLTDQGRVLEIDIATGQVLWDYRNSHSLEAYFLARDIESEQRIVRFATYGAYYVGRPSFLN